MTIVAFKSSLLSLETRQWPRWSADGCRVHVRVVCCTWDDSVTPRVFPLFTQDLVGCARVVFPHGEHSPSVVFLVLVWSPTRTGHCGAGSKLPAPLPSSPTLTNTGDDGLSHTPHCEHTPPELPEWCLDERQGVLALDIVDIPNP